MVEGSTFNVDNNKQLYERHAFSYGANMYRKCKSCGKEFQDFNQGVVYSSIAKGILDFCSDVCCKKHLDSTTV